MRTLRQDLWANVTERLGDRWGRGIRYGEVPPNANPEDIETLAVILQQMSDNLYAIEQMPDSSPDIFAEDAFDSGFNKQLLALVAAYDQGSAR